MKKYKLRVKKTNAVKTTVRNNEIKQNNTSHEKKLTSERVRMYIKKRKIFVVLKVLLKTSSRCRVRKAKRQSGANRRHTKCRDSDLSIYCIANFYLSSVKSRHLTELK